MRGRSATTRTPSRKLRDNDGDVRQSTGIFSNNEVRAWLGMVSGVSIRVEMLHFECSEHNPPPYPTLTHLQMDSYFLAMRHWWQNLASLCIEFFPHRFCFCSASVQCSGVTTASSDSSSSCGFILLGSCVTVPLCVKTEYIGPINAYILTSVKRYCSGCVISQTVYSTLVFIAITWRLLSIVATEDSTRCRICYPPRKGPPRSFLKPSFETDCNITCAHVHYLVRKQLKPR